MGDYVVYFDETGDDGVTTASSDHFVLTSLLSLGTGCQEGDFKGIYPFHMFNRREDY